MENFVKVMFGTTSSANGFVYKEDKVNVNNIDLVIREVDDFLKPGYYWDKKGNEEVIKEIYDYLLHIKHEKDKMRKLDKIN